INPPIKRKMNVCPYAPPVSLIPVRPSRGNKRRGSRAVASMEMASVIHQVANPAVVASTAFAGAESPAEWTNKRIRIQKTGPGQRPKRSFLIVIRRSVCKNIVHGVGAFRFELMFYARDRNILPIKCIAKAFGNGSAFVVKILCPGEPVGALPVGF